MENLKSFRSKKQHQRLGSDQTRVMQLGNKQLLVTVPAEIARWKHIAKASVLKWSDAGPGRVLLEIVDDNKTT